MDIRTNVDGLVRDSNTKAILNVDVAAYERYKHHRAREKRMDMLEEELDSIKDDIGDIKNLLLILTNK